MIHHNCICVAFAGAVVMAAPAVAQPYDLSAVDGMLTAALPQFDGNVAVLLTQGGREIYRFEAGEFDVDSVVRIASATKWVSAGVISSLVDDGLLGLDDRLGDHLPAFESNGKGDITVLDAWSMRHGLFGAPRYERAPAFTLGLSTWWIAQNSQVAFAPGEQLGYDGKGMQATGHIGVHVSGAADWHSLAAERILGPCDMTSTSYTQFGSNPAIAAGIRTSARDYIRFVEMVLDGGVCDGVDVLSLDSIEQMFTNHTQQLPVHHSPWPEDHLLYRYGTRPTYGLGAWVVAHHPLTGVVEEISSPGAWGTYTWADRRRGVAGVLVTDIAAGAQASLGPALRLFAMIRNRLDQQQVGKIGVIPSAQGKPLLRWKSVADAIAYRVYRRDEAILTVHDLLDAELITADATGTALLLDDAVGHYAVLAVFPGRHVNYALRPDRNTLLHPVSDNWASVSARPSSDRLRATRSQWGGPRPAAPGRE